ncbi:MAG: serine/threonine protein kinase [Myxococcales bacterium]|nr:serine/threonine protein kinase [Myxococcales bacterium]
MHQLLGLGGFGAVYRAQHVHTGQMVALKVLKRQLNADAGMLDRLLREARAASAVDSEHIVRVLDAGVSSEGQAFLAMELLDGWDLKELVTRSGPLPLMRSVMIVVQVLDALSSAHGKGIVHRDLKPANVFLLRVVNESGVERDFVKLLDFGISKMHQEGPLNSLTLPGMAMGTPAYMASEQFGSARDVDARADLYSVAVILYELASGRLPFDAESYGDLVVKVRTTAPPPLASLAPQIPPALAAVVDRGQSREAASRWQSAFDFADALRAAMGLPRPARPPGPRKTRPPEVSMAQTFTPTPAAVTPAGPIASPVPLSAASLMGATAPPSPSNPGWTPQLARATPATPPPPLTGPILNALPVQPVPRPAPPPKAAASSQAWVWIVGVALALATLGVLLEMCGG